MHKGNSQERGREVDETWINQKENAILKLLNMKIMKKLEIFNI